MEPGEHTGRVDLFGGELIASLVRTGWRWPRSRVLPAIQDQPFAYDYVLDSCVVLVRLLVSGVIHDGGGVEYSHICPV